MTPKPYYTYGEFLATLSAEAPTSHTVEDTRTPPSKEAVPRHADKPHPKRPRKRIRGRTVALVVCVLLAVLSALLLAADFFSPNGLTEYLVNVFAPEAPAVYAVAYGTYDNLAEARAASDGVRIQGGAGFIAYDGSYRVLLSAYPTRDEADTVAQKYGYTIYPILTQGMTAADIALTYRSKAKAILDYHTELYRDLYALSDQLAAEGTTIAYCRQRIAAIRDGLTARAEPFLDAAEHATDTATVNYRSGVLACLSGLDNLVHHEDALFLADLRWTYIMVLRINRL